MQAHASLKRKMKILAWSTFKNRKRGKNIQRSLYEVVLLLEERAIRCSQPCLGVVWYLCCRDNSPEHVIRCWKLQGHSCQARHPVNACY